MKPKIFVVPSGMLQQQLFPEHVQQALAAFADPIYNEAEGRLSEEELAAHLAGCAGVITGWGTPRFSPAVLDRTPHLQLISHAAGSIKFLMPEPPEELFRRGITLTNATQTMSRYVAECTLALTIACLRRVSQYREAMKHSDFWWGTYSEYRPDTLFEQRVGLVGLGSTSWEFVRLLQPFGCELWAYSRHADHARAAAAGIKLVELDELLANCRVVCLFAASRPDTAGMISRERLALIPDGGVLINTARGVLIDEPALLEELKAGRLCAGLDVTYPEPPTADSPLRTLPNVLLTPHVGGPVPSRYSDMSAFAVEEARRFFAGEPLRGQVTEARFAGIA